MRIFELPSSDLPREVGQAHGEMFRPLIQEIAEIRVELCAELGKLKTRTAVIAAAEAHLPVLMKWDHSLYEEIVGIAEGADIPPSHVIVLNHYTDLKDLGSGDSVPENVAEECSAVFANTPSETLLGQTWDMHGSAEPYVMMMGVPSRNEHPKSWVLTITGCVGMAGLNEAGVGITINNLNSTDARVGIVWPALVRRALRERTAEAAKDVILKCPMGSGHHYLVAAHRKGFGIETSGTRHEVVFDNNQDLYVHTNHCVGTSVAECTTIPSGSTTHERFDFLSRNLTPQTLKDREHLWAYLGSHEGYPRSVCTHLATPKRPHLSRTCGAIVMDLTRAEAWATHGCINMSQPHTLGFGR